jgi:hypothetical protein
MDIHHPEMLRPHYAAQTTRWDYGPQYRSQVACNLDCHAWAMDMARANRTPGTKATWLRKAAIYRSNARDFLRRLRIVEAAR